jgi:O-antigen ligase
MYLTETYPQIKPYWIAPTLLIAIVIGFMIARGAWAPLAGIVGLSLLMICPAYLWLGVFVLLIPFDSVSALGSGAQGLTLTSLVGLITLFVLFGSALALRRFRLPPCSAIWWCAFIVWGSCTVLWAADRDVVIERLPTILSLFVFYLIVTSCHFSAKELSQITRLAILGGCIAAVIAINEFQSGIFYHDLNMRGSIVFGDRQTDPNVFAASLLLPLSLVMGEFLGSAKLRVKLLLSFCALLIAVGIFVTTSRGALVAIGVMVLFYMRKLGIHWRALVPATLLGGALLLAPGFLLNRVQDSQTSAGGGRLYIWQTGEAALKDYFLAGAGLDNFGVVYNNYASHALHFVGLNRAAHNIYLQIAVELGIIGLLLFVFVVISHMRYGAQREKFSSGPVLYRLIACEAAACGILVAAFFLGLLWTKTFWAVWMMLAICSRAPRVDQSIEPIPMEPISIEPISNELQISRQISEALVN